MRRRRWLIAGVLALLPTLLLAGLATTGLAAQTAGAAEPGGIRTFTAPGEIVVQADVSYADGADGAPVRLDVCVPPGDREIPRASVVSIHGGSWARGDKADRNWRQVCRWLASEGFVAFSANYSLAPRAPFPSAIGEIAGLVDWLRAPEQARRWNLDPARIGAFGGSAGGNLAALLGVRGSGALDGPGRVRAVVELSAPVDLRSGALVRDDASPWLVGIIADYVGCDPLTGEAACPPSVEASPAAWVDPTDPAFFIAHSSDEIIPAGQSAEFAKALAAAGVTAELRVLPGARHSVGMLDENMRAEVAQFLREHLR